MSYALTFGLTIWREGVAAVTFALETYAANQPTPVSDAGTKTAQILRIG